jgi:Leucine-rich repeat (LRR) protein
MKLIRCFFLCILFGSLGAGLKAQQPLAEDTTSIAEYKAQVGQLVSFLQFTINTIGDPNTSAREKNIIINQSYRKIFRDEQVQVEDDLAGTRSTVTNKDIQAYLKDIDFFFRQVRFEFSLEEVTHAINDQSELYFRARLSRHLEGITVDGDTLSNSQPRFIELNVNPESRVLKIVSIYTNKISEKESLRAWWNELPYDWKQLFAAEVMVNDSLSMASILKTYGRARIGDTLRQVREEWIVINDSASWAWAQGLRREVYFGDSLRVVHHDSMVLNQPLLYDHLRRLVDSEELDLSYNPSLTTLEPLAAFTELRRLNVSGTVIADLIPLRNLTRLEYLNCANTYVQSLDPLQYHVNLRELNLGETRVRDIDLVGNFVRLERFLLPKTEVEDLAAVRNLTALRELDLSHTAIREIEALRPLEKLELLRLSYTQVRDLSPLSGKTNLQILYCEHTLIDRLDPLAEATALRLLFCDHTPVVSLEPLRGLPELRRVYCDNTLVRPQEANRFMREQPTTLIVYESATLQQWWQGLDPSWKAVFSEQVPIPTEGPSREQLAQVSGLTEIDLRGRNGISSLEPLQLLPNLQYLYCPALPITSFAPLRDLIELRLLDANDTEVSDLTPLQYLGQLEELRLSGTQVGDLSPLSGLGRLQRLYCELTAVGDLMPLSQLKDLRWVYCDGSQVTADNVRHLLAMRPEVCVVFETEHLQQWWSGLPEGWQRVFRRQAILDEAPDREQLHQLVILDSLSLTDQRELTDLEPLREFLHLRVLRMEKTSISDLTPLVALSSLEVLVCAQSPLSDLTPLSRLINLRSLNIENTRVEDLDPLGTLYLLETLYCSGTQVRKLNALSALHALERLDISLTDVRNLKPLFGLKNLKLLRCFNTRLREKRVEQFQEAVPGCEVVYY